MFKRRFPLCDAATGGDAGAGAGGAPGAAPGAPAGAGAAAPGAAPAAAGDQPAAAAPAAGAPSALQTAGDPFGHVPEKFRVFKADDAKALDADQSLRKVAASYAELERRLRDNGAPPAAVTDYKIEPPAELKDAVKADDPALQGFLKAAHEAGFSQKQLDVALAGFFVTAPKLVAGAVALDADACVAEMRKQWAEPAAFNAGFAAADRAVRAYAGSSYDAVAAKFGNDPDFIRLMASVGKDIGEDRPAAAAQQMPAEDVRALEMSQAYTDPKHPDHARVSRQVREYHERTAGNGAPSF